MTVEIAASELRFWTEKDGREGKSVGELKCAVTPFDVWSKGVGWRTESVVVPLSKLKTAVMGGAGVGDAVGVGDGEGEGDGVIVWVGVGVGLFVWAGVGVGFGVGKLVEDGFGVIELVWVGLGLGVELGVGELVIVGIGVGVGEIEFEGTLLEAYQTILTIITMLTTIIIRSFGVVKNFPAIFKIFG